MYLQQLYTNRFRSGIYRETKFCRSEKVISSELQKYLQKDRIVTVLFKNAADVSAGSDIGLQDKNLSGNTKRAAPTDCYYYVERTCRRDSVRL